MATNAQRPDPVVAIAARQHGNVTRQQLLELGLGPAAIAYRVRSGRLHRVHAGVYALGTPAATALERAAAAVLAGGPGAMLSQASALALWGWRHNGWPRVMEVTVIHDRRPKGILVHQSRTLRQRDIRRRHGIQVTSPARTLLDCAPRLTGPARVRAVNDALRSGALRSEQLAELLQRCRPHPGAASLRAFTEQLDGPTRSELEDGFLDLCARFDLPRPQVNTVVGGYEVDAYFQAERLIVELDGWDFHNSRQAFERDRGRDADALATGIATVRLTWQRLQRRPQQEARRLERILVAQRRRGAQADAPGTGSPSSSISTRSL